MKRTFALILVCFLLFCLVNAVAENVDYTSLSDTELQTMITMARNELAKRDHGLTENTVFLDCEKCKVYRDGAKEIHFQNGCLYIPVIMVSDAAEEVSFQLDSVQINGWDCSGIIGNISAAGKKRDEIMINCAGAEISSMEEIEDIKVVVIAFNMGTFEREGESDSLSFCINQ